MGKKPAEDKTDAEFRRKALEKLKPDTIPVGNLSEAEVRKLAHELQIHQIELEMQAEELRKSQTLLEESRQKYLNLYDLAPVGYFTLNEKGFIQEINFAGAFMLGAERHLLINKPLSKYIAREDADLFYLHRKRASETGNKETCELRMLKGDQPFYAQLESRAIPHSKNNINRYLIVITDISERVQAQIKLNEINETLEQEITERTKELLQSKKLESIGIMTTGIAHGFNNILAIIDGKIQMLMRENKGREKLLDELRFIRKSVKDGAEIVINMNKFARAREDCVRFVAIDLRQEIKSTINHTRPIWNECAEREGIAYTINLDGVKHVSCIKGNPLELQEVLINIINNAFDAMPGGGTLSFSTREENGSVVLEISDTGTGMDEETQAKIFDPFFTTKEHDTGLGMSIVYGTVKRHGGKIMVQSQMGRGSTFILSFPAVKESPGITKSDHEPGKALPGKNGGGNRILIVDDEATLGNVLSRFLTGEGYNVVFADNGAGALDLL
ncbi:MAG: ATP-binding protein, partial [Candidatus Kuenenia sp.]|nr:ATP-binding protein [Candidatus Kuenenia sp.]